MNWTVLLFTVFLMTGYLSAQTAPAEQPAKDASQEAPAAEQPAKDSAAQTTQETASSQPAEEKKETSVEELAKKFEEL